MAIPISNEIIILRGKGNRIQMQICNAKDRINGVTVIILSQPSIHACMNKIKWSHLKLVSTMLYTSVQVGGCPLFIIININKESHDVNYSASFAFKLIGTAFSSRCEATHATLVANKVRHHGEAYSYSYNRPPTCSCYRTRNSKSESVFCCHREAMYFLHGYS